MDKMWCEAEEGMEDGNAMNVQNENKTRSNVMTMTDYWKYQKNQEKSGWVNERNKVSVGVLRVRVPLMWFIYY